MTGEFELSGVLPWGRTRAEYAAFFDLADLGLETRVLDRAGGPSSFNAEMTAAGFGVVSADLRAASPRFVLDGPAAIEARIFPLLDLDGEPSKHLEPRRARGQRPWNRRRAGRLRVPEGRARHAAGDAVGGVTTHPPAPR